MKRVHVIAAGALFLMPGTALSQLHAPYILADRTNDALSVVRDADGSGAINEPLESTIWFNAANAAGTLGPSNPTALATCYTCGMYGYTVMGDQLNRAVYVLWGDPYTLSAQGASDSLVAADATNASGVSFAFPTGVAFDPQGRVYVVNAGNASGNDGIYRLTDLNGDGDFQDAGEISDYVTTGAFGAGNGPYSPQEIVFDAAGVGYLHNSSANLHGIYRFQDIDANGRADDSGEFTPWFDAANASGILLSAGFALEPDRVRARALYMLQIASGGVDQLIRAQDLDNDGDANDAGEATIVWQTAEAGFSAIDIYCTVGGRVFVTDNSGKRVIVLTDVDGDGLFTSAGERADFYAGVTLMGDIRQIAALPCNGDLDFDFSISLSDLTRLLSHFGVAGGAAYEDGDLDGNGAIDLADLAAMLSIFGYRCE
ncbi:MAG: hypothetical protein HZB38_17490 [Planctomycetes bacterium]|nr:hypothetical protein [Planctomycetota bacterium]